MVGAPCAPDPIRQYGGEDVPVQPEDRDRQAHGKLVGLGPGGVYMGVYEDLAAAKANGIVLTLKSLSQKDLKSMFVHEHIPDSMIADLYGVPKSRILA